MAAEDGRRDGASLCRICPPRAAMDLCARLSRAVFLFSACAAILFGAYIVSRAMPPEYKISWMFPALIAPFLGGALFLFFGNSRFGLKNDRSYTKKSLGLDAYLPAPAQGDGLFFEAAETIFCETGYPAARGDVSYYATGERFFDALLSAIEGAKHFVFLEFFIAKRASSGTGWKGYFSARQRNRRRSAWCWTIWGVWAESAGGTAKHWSARASESTTSIPFSGWTASTTARTGSSPSSTGRRDFSAAPTLRTNISRGTVNSDTGRIPAFR